MKQREIKVNITYTPGYEQRFTKAACDAVFKGKALEKSNKQKAV